MATYMTISMDCKGKTHYFHAEQNQHNHTKSNEFGKAARALTAQNYDVAPTQVREGHYASNQAKSAIKSNSNELVYKGGKWVQKG
jgi:hypothetical protein